MNVYVVVTPHCAFDEGWSLMENIGFFWTREAAQRVVDSLTSVDPHYPLEVAQVPLADGHNPLTK